MKQASRMYIRRHARPRDEQGRFLAGRQLWTREDGQTRWIHFLQPDGNYRPSLEERFFDWLRGPLPYVVIIASMLMIGAAMVWVVR